MHDLKKQGTFERESARRPEDGVGFPADLDDFRHRSGELSRGRGAITSGGHGTTPIRP